MRILFYTVIIFAAFTFTSCVDMGERVNGNGRTKTENRSVNKGDRIKVTGDIDVTVSQGPLSVKIEADENILPYIEISNHEDWLEIKTRDNINLNTSNGIKVQVTTPELTDVSTSGSGDITCSRKFSTSNKMTFTVNGSGDISAEINCPKVESRISGSGNVKLNGETKDVEVHIVGSGNFEGPDLKSENADISIAGSGDANLFADASLKASVTGSGNIKYKGNAAVTSRITGSGGVSKIE